MFLVLTVQCTKQNLIPETTAPNYWNLSSDVDDQLQPLKVDFLDEREEVDLKVINVKVKYFDATNDLGTDDQPDSEDVRCIQILQVSRIA